MLTIDALKDYGADVSDGLNRCMNNEAFYLKLVNTVIGDTRGEELEKLIDSGDLAGAFEVAHALKGMYANLSLTPVLKPVVEITELLRARTECDYTELVSEIKKQQEALRSLAR